MTSKINEEKKITTENPKPNLKEMALSIFRPYKNQEEKVKRFDFIHFAFKDVFLIPVLHSAEKLLGKFMITKREDIPDEPYNRNFFIIWDNYEEATRNWWWTFKNIDNMEPELRKQHIKMWEDRHTRKGGQHFYYISKFLLRLGLTICLEDTAYRELLNFNMYHLRANMNKEYDPQIKHEHIMYTGAYDMNLPYFMQWIKKAGVKKGQKVMLNVEFKGEEEDEENIQGTTQTKSSKTVSKGIKTDDNTEKPGQTTKTTGV